ncbi:MAG: S8 family serine peptidase [Planctomycetes bacterium]|nr:S8 family serine peptidase [Planctomycetota bacterium]
MKTVRCGAVVLCAGMALSIGASVASAADPLEAYMNSIRLNELLAKGLDGTGVNVGHMEYDRPNASHVSLVGQDITFWGSTPVATHPHETGVASLIIGKRTVDGGNFQGVATKASLWMSGMGAQSPANYKAAMDWQLTAPKTTVVNNSWGQDWDAGTEAERNRYRRIADRAAMLGQLNVCAAGNEGQEAGTGGNKTGNLTNPANAYNTLSVGAVGPAGTWNRVADFSSVSEADNDGKPTARLKVDIVAPGVGIKQAFGPANDAFSARSGTSFATPITTGVVALLQQHGMAKGFSIDPRLMRAVVMNSANKAVENRAGVRWDKEFKAGANGTAANRTSNESGAGMLDAMEAYTQYDAGRNGPTLKAQNFIGDTVRSTGWDVNTVNGVGLDNSNDYETTFALRKGTYLTSTLVWNRDVNSTDADLNNWTYEALAGMNLGIAKGGAFGTLVSVSNMGEQTGGGENDALKGTSQHNVYKTGDRSQYWMRAYLRSTSPIASVTYALAWRGYEMDTHNVQSFNGGFDGDRGAYRDNGWFKDANAITYGEAVREAWMPGNADNWAMRMVSVLGIQAGVSQEVVRPFSFFVLTFDVAFGAANFLSRLDVFLGNLLLGTVFADGSNTQAFQFIGNFTLDSVQLAALGPGNFVDLSFKFTSLDANTAFIDNVEYIPSAPTLALLGLAGVLAGRRRRA